MGVLGTILMLRDSGFSFDDTVVTWILTVLLILFMFTVGTAAVSFPWVLMAEWFSPDLKSIVNTSMITHSFIMVFFAVQTSSLIQGFIGTAGLFLYFFGICIFMTIFVGVF